MECFAHPNEKAAGLCKSCGKGVCRACAIDVDRGLACSPACKPYAQALSQLQVTSIGNIGLLSAQRFAQPLFALVFLCTGLYFLYTSPADAFTWFLLSAGTTMALVSVVSLVKRARQRLSRAFP